MFEIRSAAKASALLTLMLLITSACTSGQRGTPSAPAPAPVSEDYPAPVESDYLIGNYHFRSGETLPELKIHYRTIGTLRRDSSGRATNAVLLLHGTADSGKQMLTPSFANYLFGAGQPLDAARYFVILPDEVGHGASSKPSDGLHASFPHYDYHDMVDSTHELVTRKLGVDHLRLVLGVSMGGMQTWMWGEEYPDLTGALMALASNPVQIGGVNRIWRKEIIDAIRNDPDWQGGQYKTEPVKALATVADITLLAPKSAPIYLQQIAPTGPEADKFYEDQTSAQIARMDANDTLYAFEASRDYNPEPDLEKITAPMVAVNSADDYINPASLGIVDRDIKRVKNGRFVLLPATDQTRGHYTYILANIWEDNLTAVLAESGH
jgi:homoserine O-acetyltransferase/O-succinyltransferase